jgi:hypothetical protein
MMSQRILWGWTSYYMWQSVHLKARVDEKYLNGLYRCKNVTGRIVTIEKFTWWTDSVDRIVAWSVRGWTDCQGTVVYRSKINHERDVHCMFILGLLARMPTILTLFFSPFLKISLGFWLILRSVLYLIGEIFLGFEKQFCAKCGKKNFSL